MILFRCLTQPFRYRFSLVSAFFGLDEKRKRRPAEHMYTHIKEYSVNYVTDRQEPSSNNFLFFFSTGVKLHNFAADSFANYGFVFSQT